MADDREDHTVEEMRYAKTVAYVIHFLISAAVVAGVGIGVTVRLNSAALDSMKTVVRAHDDFIRELQLELHNLETTSGVQSQKLLFMGEQLKECQQDLRRWNKLGRQQYPQLRSWEGRTK